MKHICMRRPWTFIFMHEFFSCLSIASVDGKQCLSEVVFSTLVRFSLYTMSMHQRVLQGCPTWCCAVQETRVVVNRQLPPPSWQCTTGSITKEYYRDVLHDAVQCKRLELWSTGNCRLHHDNAPAHSSHFIQLFLVKNQTPVVCQTPYSPDMAPCDFWLFPKLKRPLKGKWFQTREDIMTAMTAELNTIPKEAFSECFQQWCHRWEKSEESQGDYFEDN